MEHQNDNRDDRSIPNNAGAYIDLMELRMCPFVFKHTSERRYQTNRGYECKKHFVYLKITHRTFRSY